ncbi:MAG TPA: chromate resistance protein ChrB domain-containing protein [Thermoanaerobaculia bacterium]|nr:chromate resistance protein ChrB domain-containing protein [Thermoanaerobaculia bacterium]
MQWLGLSYTLPSASASSKRVAVWRRLQKLGAVSPTGSLYILPAGEDSAEALGWLAQEIEDGGGEALVLRVDRFEETAEQAAEARLIELFRASSDEEYRKIAAEAEEALEPAGQKGLRERLEKLRRRFGEVARIDFFQAPEGPRATAALARIEAALSRGDGASREVPAAERSRYQGRRWVTRPHPHVDRLACAWLIRRFVDPAAEIRYAEAPEEGEVSFDMRDADFGHRGNLCTFETMLAAFALGDDPALAALAAIVHEIDLRDGAAASPEVSGVDAILQGWSIAGWPDPELERHGIALFEGLYTALRQTRSVKPSSRKKKKP